MVHETYSYHLKADLLSTVFQIPLMIRRLQSRQETQLPASSLSLCLHHHLLRPLGFI